MSSSYKLSLKVTLAFIQPHDVCGVHPPIMMVRTQQLWRVASDMAWAIQPGCARILAFGVGVIPIAPAAASGMRAFGQRPAVTKPCSEIRPSSTPSSTTGRKVTLLGLSIACERLR